MSAEPHRRLKLDLELEADTLTDLADALHSITFDLVRDGRETAKQVSGGHRSGHILRLTCDESVTGESFRAALDAHMAAKRTESSR